MRAKYINFLREKLVFTECLNVLAN